MLRVTDEHLAVDAAKAIRHIKKVDPDLARVIRRIGVCDLVVDKSRTIYASLVRSIVYQQLTGKVAAIIFGRFLKLFPGDVLEFHGISVAFKLLDFHGNCVCFSAIGVSL